MTSRESPIAGLTRALAAHGFVYRGRNTDSWLTFGGSLTAEGTIHAIQLAVQPEGRELPRIVLESIPAELRPIAPHLGSNGGLCYAMAGSIVLDVFDIAGQTLACVDRAQQILSSMLRGELIADLEEEFFAYWNGDFCFMDLRQSSHDRVECIIAKRHQQGRVAVFVTNDRMRTLSKIAAFGAHEDDSIHATVRRIKTDAKPRPLASDWPPRTVRDVLHWQGLLDMSCRRKLDRHVTEVFKSGQHWMLCVIESPKLPYAFWIDFTKFRRVKGARRVTQAREFVYGAEVTPVSCVRVDNQYIVERAAPDRASLMKRRIAVVGCGTIGGYLAELVVKAGAGSDGGVLTLVDNDVLLPQNIGRHRLGFDSILKNKAVALAEEMSRNMPGADIRALPVDCMQADLAGFDIVVNATGEEALGHLLTSKLLAPRFVPSLTVWIEGPGTVVRALLRDTHAAACTRCMSSSDRRPLYAAIEGEMPTLLAGQGCESLYVPFPATASVQAACLATEILTDWAGGVTSPRLRTRVLDARFLKGAADQNPPSLIGCPACGT
ncbi:MAG: ThiF family adenylyltransferase [Gammaproteobacteria bacterium]